MSKNQPRVLGYIKPTSYFKTIDQWQAVAKQLLELQDAGFDSRGGKLSCKAASFCSREDFDKFIKIIIENFGFLLGTEVERYELLTKKNVLDFIEDFVNHRVWGIEKEFGSYFPDITKLKFAYFYSRGDIEPYVLLDEEYTQQIYHSIWNPKIVCHYTTKAGVSRIQEALKSGNGFDLSSFTYMERPFFRDESNICLTIMGNVRAAFRSDIKSFATDSGRRACNLYRLQYPGDDLTNICYDLNGCDSERRTHLWNEFIITPIEILEITYKPESK